jgi:hypothetical protein
MAVRKRMGEKKVDHSGPGKRDGSDCHEDGGPPWLYIRIFTMMLDAC